VNLRCARLTGFSVLATGLCLLPAAPAAAKPKGFSFGVAAGDVRQHSAILWAHARRPGLTQIQVIRFGRFNRCDPEGAERKRRVRAKAANNLTVQRKVRGLLAGTIYRYRFCAEGGRHSATGSFKTPPRPGRDRMIRFGFSGDMDAQPLLGSSQPYWNNFGVLERMRSENNDFNILMGDTMYTDSEVPGASRATLALGTRQKWGKYRQNLGLAPHPAMRGSASFYGHWDDHEFINDFSPAEDDFEGDFGEVQFDGRKLYKRGLRAFRDYTPVTYSKKKGLYRTFRWGKNLELFFLDERSFRSANADANNTCDNPQTGEPDLAPTSEGSLARTEFGLIISSLRQPVPPACLAAINDPNRTMLGKAQLARFKQAVARSTATFKVIVNELPIQQYYILPYDRWEGFEAERKNVIRFLRDNVKNVVFLAADVHANLVNDARLNTVGPGGVQNSGILEVTTGPIATKAFKRQIDEEAGSGVGDGVYGSVLKPPPPQGLGMLCAAIDVFSYAEVSVTSGQLRIDLRDIDGEQVRETFRGAPGPTCGPYVINAE
jgi:alkaline phosphatase D